MALDADEISRYVHYLERMMKHLSKENTQLKKELSKYKDKALTTKANTVDWVVRPSPVYDRVMSAEERAGVGRPYRG